MEPTALASVQFEGSLTTNPGRFEAKLQSQAGDVFDTKKAESYARRLAASGDYTRADYRLVTGPNGESLMFDLLDKPGLQRPARAASTCTPTSAATAAST